MLARDGIVTGNRIGPARSSCAIHVSSYNSNRENIYHQQQTISGCGLSGIAFSTNVPHTVRGGNKHMLNPGARHERNEELHRLPPLEEQRQQRDHGPAPDAGHELHELHGQVLLGRRGRARLRGGRRHRAGRAAGRHRQLAAPHRLSRAVREAPRARLRCSSIAHEHPGRDILDQLRHPLQKPEILQVQARGEYLYAACGCGGFRAFDIAFIDHKGFSERITTAPVSPAGQQFYVPTQYATAIAAPTTLAPDPTRKQLPENREQAVHPLYAYIYVTDKYEGLILVGAARCSTAIRSTTSWSGRSPTTPAACSPGRGTSRSPARTPTSRATPAWSSSASTIRSIPM